MGPWIRAVENEIAEQQCAHGSIGHAVAREAGGDPPPCVPAGELADERDTVRGLEHLSRPTVRDRGVDESEPPAQIALQGREVRMGLALGTGLVIRTAENGEVARAGRLDAKILV